MNLSPADLFLPFAVGSVALKVERPTGAARDAARSKVLDWALYLTALSIALLIAFFVRCAEGVTTEFAYGIFAVAKLWISLLYFGVFAISARWMHRDVDQLLRLWVWASCVAAVSGIVGAVLWSRGISTPFAFDFRATGGFSDPNLFALYLLIGIALTFVAHSRGLFRHPYLLIGTQAMALLLTGSRAGVPALGVGIAIALVLGRRRVVLRRLAPWLALMVGGYVVARTMWPSLSLQSLTRIADAGSSVGSDVRVELWSLAWRMWLDHPLFGVGIGQFRIAAGDYASFVVDHIPHNTHLGLLAETGLAGYLLIMGLPILIIIRLVGLVRTAGWDSVPTWMILGIIGSLTMAFTLNVENERFLWAYFGLCYGYALRARAAATVDARHGLPATLGR